MVYIGFFCCIAIGAKERGGETAQGTHALDQGAYYHISVRVYRRWLAICVTKGPLCYNIFLGCSSPFMLSVTGAAVRERVFL